MKSPLPPQLLLSLMSCFICFRSFSIIYIKKNVGFTIFIKKKESRKNFKKLIWALFTEYIYFLCRLVLCQTFHSYILFSLIFCYPMISTATVELLCTFYKKTLLFWFSKPFLEQDSFCIFMKRIEILSKSDTLPTIS